MPSLTQEIVIAASGDQEAEGLDLHDLLNRQEGRLIILSNLQSINLRTNLHSSIGGVRREMCSLVAMSMRREWFRLNVGKTFVVFQGGGWQGKRHAATNDSIDDGFISLWNLEGQIGILRSSDVAVAIGLVGRAVDLTEFVRRVMLKVKDLIDASFSKRRNASLTTRFLEENYSMAWKSSPTCSPDRTLI